MRKKGIGTFRIIAVSMVTAMVVNSAGITALAKEGNADFDESDIIVICTDAEDGTDDGEFDEKDSIIEDSEESEKEETEEKEDGEESEDNKDTEEESEDIKDTEDEEESEDDKGIEDGIEVEDSDENDEEDLNKVINKLELTADATYSNSELAAYTEIVLNGYTLTVTDDFSTNASISLGTGQLIVKGNMTASNYVNGANGEITIEGTYTQTANRIGVGSKMTVQNDFVISNGGFISASGSSGRVIVGGNLIYKSAEDMDFNNTATWIVSGNVIQEEYSGKYNAGNIVLNGTVPQTLSLQSNSTIGNLTVNNSDVNLEGYLYGVSLQSDFEPTTTGKIYTYNLNLNGHRFVVSNDLEVAGNTKVESSAYLEVNGDMNIKDGVKVNAGEMTVNGNVTASGSLQGNSGKITINGSYTQTASDLRIGSAEVTITGDAVFKNSGTIAYANGGKVSIGGDLSYKSSTDMTTSNKTTWTVSGNVIQDEYAGKYYVGNLVLNGKSPQELFLQSNSSISNLPISNEDVTIGANLNGAVLQTDFEPTMTGILYTTGLDLNGHKFVVQNGLESSGTIKAGTGGTLVVNGDMKAAGDVQLGTGEISVTGNYTQTTNDLRPENGKLTVEKDLIFQQSGSIRATGVKGKVFVGGDLYYKSFTNMSADNLATWTVLGNVTQEADTGKYNVGNLLLPNSGSEISLTNGSINTLTLSYGKSHYTINPDECYNKLIATSVLTFDANGGIVDKDNIKITTEQKYGELPVPTKDGFYFIGWFTKKTGGEQITKDDVVTAVDDFTAYAHWTDLPPMSFDDVKPTDWWYKAVLYVYENKIMSGTNGGKSFSPTGKLTREQFTQVLYAYEGKPDVTQKNVFSDVDENAWYAKSVLWAKEKGISNGKPNGTFGVGQRISRQDLAVMLYTYAQYKGFDLTKNADALDGFNDKGKVSGYATEAMKWAVTQGVISGKGNGRVDPVGEANRAECAAMIMKLIEKNTPAE